MRLTTKSEYALLALIYIARQGPDSVVQSETICSKYTISKKYLEQLFIILKAGKYIKTKRGASGGYALARPANKITVAEVIRLMDGPLAPIESVSDYFFSHTPLEQEKKITAVLREIRDYVANKLESLMIQDLI